MPPDGVLKLCEASVFSYGGSLSACHGKSGMDVDLLINY